MNKKKMTAGPRIGAMILDHISMCIIITILVLPFISLEFNNAFGESSSNAKKSIDWMTLVMIFGMSLYLNKDIFEGKSIAKRVLKQEVIDIKTEKVATPLKCLIRNITIILWPVEVIVVLINPTRRLGDFIAGTRVDYVTEEQDSKKKIDSKNILVSLLLGFLILYIPSLFFVGKFGNGTLDRPNYVESSYNETLSITLEHHLDSLMSEYLIKVNIQVYDSITNDSLKYIAANFLLKENYITNDSQFNLIKKEIFNSMFEIVPKKDFVLFGKFIYDDRTSKQSSWRIYDWRKNE